MKTILALLVFLCTWMLPFTLPAQPDTSRLDELERRLIEVEQRSRGDQATGVAVFVCGAFCALWAQQTGRNPWLWFFLGLFFSIITLCVLLYKNAGDRRAGASR